MTPSNSLPPRFAANTGRLKRAGFVVMLLCGSLVSADEGRGIGERSGVNGNSYLIDVPVVSAVPIQTTRVVERPEKTCTRVASTERYDRSSRSYPRRSHYEPYPGERRSRGSGGIGAQILGGLVGGAIGNQFGGGNGKKALTIAGALIGSSIARGDRRRARSDDYYDDRRTYHDAGDDYFEPRPAGHRDEASYQPEYQCRTTTRTRQITEVTGFDVTYRYNNSLHKRRMDHDPGDTLELRVRAVPDVDASVTQS